MPNCHRLTVKPARRSRAGSRVMCKQAFRQLSFCRNCIFMKPLLWFTTSVHQSNSLISKSFYRILRFRKSSLSMYTITSNCLFGSTSLARSTGWWAAVQELGQQSKELWLPQEPGDGGALRNGGHNILGEHYNQKVNHVTDLKYIIKKNGRWKLNIEDNLWANQFQTLAICIKPNI